MNFSGHGAQEPFLIFWVLVLGGDEATGIFKAVTCEVSKRRREYLITGERERKRERGSEQGTG